MSQLNKNDKRLAHPTSEMLKQTEIHSNQEGRGDQCLVNLLQETHGKTVGLSQGR